MTKSFHVVQSRNRTGRIGQALIAAVQESVREGRNPGKVGRMVLTHEARYNRKVFASQQG